VANKQWLAFVSENPSYQRLAHFASLHTSNRGLTRGGRQTKAEGLDQTLAVFRKAAEHVGQFPA
jgi:hypothetical protein